MITGIVAAIYMLGPVLLLYGCKRSAWLNQFGTVGLAYIFCIVVGSMADFSIFTFESLYLAAFVAVVIFGSLFFQVLFSKLFNIDTDTTIIASTAFIFSAPFVPTVANALKNKEIIISGITIGIIGYATGNFLGITLAYFLR